ncbi:hypothetical protein HUT16_33825 [Kitasatospora sp. NA04385]|uniref:hypothetical protein n=1 Tax=Kitasatospora sp. NA04385 TaxID=2742135 RepID=UPI001590E9E6|nr:hypothetical protein [Kitasatospora sp. NA04385]QKW23405.1 hypothetical protein HUT16_33825 [Kitasatospora sp. NA04385]
MEDAMEEHPEEHTEEHARAELPCRAVFTPGCDRMLRAPDWQHPDARTADRHRCADRHRRTGHDLREDLPEHLLRTLASSEDAEILVALLNHPRVPSDLVDGMLDDPSEDIRRAATYRTGDVDALWRATEDVWTVRLAVASNPRTPADLRRRLGASIAPGPAAFVGDPVF